VTLGVFAYVVLRPKIHQKSEDYFIESVGKLQSTLSQRWTLGDKEELYHQDKLKCPKLITNGQQIHSSYFECNPYYMACYLKSLPIDNNDLDFKIKQKIYSYRFVSYSIDDKSRFIATLKEKNTKKRVNLRFNNSCKDTYLPQSYYHSGARDEDGDLWDNKGRHFYIDKHYVNRGDINLWKTKKLEKNRNEFYLPEVRLKLKEKKDYCHSVGGHLLQSHIFDGASYIPSKSNRYIYRFPYPWTKKVKINNLGIKYACNYFVFKECLKKSKLIHHYPYSVTWMGIFNSLGNEVEEFDSKFDPNQSLKISSKELIFFSWAHQIGFRKQSTSFDQKSAFRCMVEL
jgi:hypothetical protein